MTEAKLDSAREALRSAKQSIAAASVASCTCNTKSSNAAFHDADCRYLKLCFALDSLDVVAEALA